MKKKFTFLMAALMLLTIIGLPGKAVGQASVGTTLWAEDFSGYSANNVPSGSIINSHTGTTVYGDDTLTYACTNGATNTQIYAANLAGGTSPELLVSKKDKSHNGGTFSVSGISTGDATELTLTYKANNANVTASSNTSGITVGSGNFSSNTYTYTISVSSVSTFNLVFTQTGTSNTRVDNFSLTVKTAGGGGSSATATTTTINSTGITNTDVYVSTAAGSLSATVTPEGESALVSPTITWTSSNPSVATIDSDGVVTLVAAGNTTITASYAGVANEYLPSSATYDLAVTSSAPDYVTLPFEWGGGGKSAFEALNGTSTSGLGSDYTGDSYGIYQMKFDNTGDYIQIKTDSQPGTVAIDALLNGNSSSTITVQASTNGTTFDAGEVLTVSGSQYDISNLATTRTFDSDVRYIRLYFTKSGSNVGVGPISITNTVPTITVTSSLEAFSYIFGNGPSASQSFTVSGINLTDPLVVTASSKYEVCKTANGTYGSSVSYPLTSGSVATSTVYVRLKAGLEVGSYATADDKIIVSSTGASNKTVSLSGSVAPVYTLTYAVSPENSGTVTLGAASLATGYTTTATAFANSGYKFTGWTISGTGASLSSASTNPTTVTMGTADVTVTANFKEVNTYAITYSVNDVTDTVYVEENTAVDFSAPASALIPAGYVFKGWRESTLTPTNTDPNDYVTLATSTQNKTYYAVMALEGFSNSTYTLNYTADVASETLGYGNAVNVTATDGSAWVVKAYKNSGMQINTGKNCSIKIPTCSGNIKSIAITCTVAKAVGFSTSNYSGSGTIDYVVYGTDATSQTLDFTGKTNTEGYIVPKAGSTSITNIVVTYKVATYSDYRTKVTSVTMTEDLTITGDLTVNYRLTVPTGKTLTVNGTLTNNDPANLIIEDGGQLIIPSAGSKEDVKATFQKEITKYITDEKDYYYLIANPTTGNINPTTVAGMLSPNYDLYYFDGSEEVAVWRNYKQGAFNLFSGKGYLYANSSNLTLEFPGTVHPGTTDTIILSKKGSGTYAGFNLVGNKLSNNITDMTIGGIECNYYKLDSEGSFVPSTADIIVGEAFMVEAPNDKDVLTLNPAKKDEAGFTNEVIRLEVSNSKFTDVAYVYFGNHLPLTKINHLNDEAPMLYIHNENSDKAVEVYNNRGEVKSINVNFEAKTMGAYTISAKMVKGEIKYMHLYDRLTGIDTDLLIDDYSFIGAKEDQPGRFILSLEATDNEFEGSENFAYQSGNNIIVSGEGELQVFDVTGRIVMRQNINGVQAVNGLNNGVYIFKLEGKTQKIVVR